MSRVRHHGSVVQNHNQSNRQTAAAYNQEGSGCLSFYLLPPLSVLFFGVMIAIILINIPVQKASSQTSNSSMSGKTRSIIYARSAVLEYRDPALERNIQP